MNLHNTIKFIADQLSNYFEGEADIVNIANVGNEDREDEKILLTLVNVEEEASLKNQKYTKMNALQKPVYMNPPVNLNLFILMSSTHADYETALKRLSTVIEFFQAKKVFTQKDGNLVNGSGEGFKLIMDLVPMSFEATNHLWGFLGGKQMPSVMYKMRMISLEAGKPADIGGTIFGVDITSAEISSGPS